MCQRKATWVTSVSLVHCYSSQSTVKRASRTVARGPIVRRATGAPAGAERGSRGPASGGEGGPRGRRPPDLILMFKILDRYLVREIVLPFALALVVFTFVLEIPPILQQAESLIAKGVEWSVVFRVLLTLLPQALSVTIPMAVLVGILVGCARLSADREFVAMQACGVSLMRLLRPIAVVAAVGSAATAYETIVALPDANQTFREIAFGVVKQRVESNVRPRVFFEDFPNRVI